MPGLIMALGTAWKKALYLGFLFLLVALKQRIVAVPPLSPFLCADTQKQSHSLACIPLPGLWAGLPSCEDKCVCVSLRTSVYVCTHISGRLNSHCQKPFASCSASSPSLAVAKSQMVGAILRQSFSTWWHTTMKLFLWTSLKHGVNHLNNVVYKWMYFLLLHVRLKKSHAS